MLEKIKASTFRNFDRSSLFLTYVVFFCAFIIGTKCVRQKSEKNSTLRPYTLNNFEIVGSEIVGQTRSLLADGISHLELDGSSSSLENQNEPESESQDSNDQEMGEEINSDVFEPMQPNKSQPINPSMEASYEVINNMDWNYKNKGADWNFGECSTGLQQSPIDLNVEGLEIAKHSDLVQTYVDAMKNPKENSRRYKNIKTWKTNDFFYHFSDFHGAINLYKDYKSMEMEPVENLPFGLLIPTDTHHIYYASKVTFHTPSEHTFQGSGNRRELEMQIWHYSKQQIPISKEDKSPEQFLSNYIQDVLENEYSEGSESFQESSSDGSWRVISLTFMSGELSNSTKKDVEDLPSEKFISSILNTHDTVTADDHYFQGQISLSHPMNLPSLFLMLQLGSLKFYTYSGSDTVPPCAENVVWYVAAEPFPLSTDTMLKFYKYINSSGLGTSMHEDGNYRELQATETSQRVSKDVKIVSGYPIQLLIQETLANL